MQVLPNTLTHVVDGISGAGAEMSPTRIVLNNVNSGSSQVTFNSYQESGAVPHFTLDPFAREVWQHLDVSQSAVGVTNPPIEPHRMGNTIWVNVMKQGELSSEDSFWAGEKVRSISDEIGCPDHWLMFPGEASVEYRTSQLSLGLWRRFEGICGAAHVPHTPANGPGAMDIDAFGFGLASQSTEPVEIIETEDTLTIETEEFTATVVVNEPVVTEMTETVLGDFPGRKVQLGSGGKAVQMLRDAYDMGKGKFDDELLTHVLLVQENAGMTQDGIVDSETWDAIDAAFKGEA